jgi:hypothetical protein
MAKETAGRVTGQRRIFWAVAMLALALPCCFVLMFFASLWPGGVRPTYHAVDHDLFLTLHAKSAKPVIEAVERHRRENGTYPASATTTDGWVYTRSRDGYVLSSKLGWDPHLEYVVEGTKSRWVFDPGDGTEEKTIVLSP